MPAIRGCGFDDAGNFWAEPSWTPEGTKVGLHVDEIATINDTGTAISTTIFKIQTLLPFVNSPLIKDPTKAANAKAQTLQTRLDGVMDKEGQFHIGEVVVTVDKATQGITVSGAEPGIPVKS